MHFLECPLWLWMEKVRPDLLPEETAGDRERMAQGRIVDELAQELFPGGVVIQGFNRPGFAATQKAIASGAKILYQPTALADGLTARADILVKGRGKTWDLHEVKATTKVKPEHPVDVAFQRMCFERSGIPIGKVSLVHLDNTYVRKGKVNPKKLLVDENVTSEADRGMEIVERYLDQAREVLSWPKTLRQEHVRLCPNPRRCDYYAAWLDATSSKKSKLPKSEPTFDSDAIAAELGKLQYPLHFFDYETYGPAVPSFNGYRPYQAVPFQFSVMVLMAPDAELRAFDFLMDTFDDPSLPLIEALQEAIGPKGSVISWNAIFEKTRNEELAEMHPEHATFLKSVNRRTFDLMQIFKRKLYDDPAFCGSASLKAVMPVLVPKLSYKSLNIQEGTTASASWPVLVGDGLSKPKRAELRRDMIEYCRLDVYGMVEILKKLYAL